MRQLNVILTESGRFKATALPKGETTNGNIVYQIVNISDVMTDMEVMRKASTISANSIRDLNFLIHHNNY